VQKEETAPNIPSSESVSEGEGDGTPAPSEDRGVEADTREEIPLNIKSTSLDQGTSLKGAGSDKKKTAKEEGMETDPSLVNKE
jgi:hypothetical protein